MGRLIEKHDPYTLIQKLEYNPEKTRQVDPATPPEVHFGMYIPGQQATQYAQEIVGNVANYEYNVWNQMIKSTSNNNIVTYRYNGDELRVEKTANDLTHLEVRLTSISRKKRWLK